VPPTWSSPESVPAYDASSVGSLGFCSDPAWDRARAHEVTRHHVTAFLLAELADDEAAAAALALAAQAITQVGYRAEGYR
jgi:hypothetical protein